MKKTAEQALQSILDYCEGYEDTDREPGQDYKRLKNFILKQKEQIGEVERNA